MDGLLEIDARDWRTPLTGTDERTVGHARLKADSYGRGHYRMEGTRGYEFYKVVKGRLPIMTLQRRHGRAWKTWMVDDPLHWWGMGERVADLPAGSVLCAGLGLGLMVHHLVRRDDITDITVVEIDPDVIELITPTLPVDDRVRIVEADYYEYIAALPFMWDGELPLPDSVLWDLAVGSPDQTRSDFVKGQVLTTMSLPTAHLSMFGERRVPRPDWMDVPV